MGVPPSLGWDARSDQAELEMFTRERARRLGEALLSVLSVSSIIGTLEGALGGTLLTRAARGFAGAARKRRNDAGCAVLAARSSSCAAGSSASGVGSGKLGETSLPRAGESLRRFIKF
jgi:hypothetical protein